MTMPRIHKPVIKVNYKFTVYTKFIPILVEHEEDEIQWA